MSGFWKNRKLFAALSVFGVSVVMFFGLLNLCTSCFGWDLPKTAVLKKENASLKARYGLLAGRIRNQKDELITLGIRDDNVYRSVFGLNPIPENIRCSSCTSDGHGEPVLLQLCDTLLSMAYVQTVSYDAIESMLDNAGDMASSIPAICPVLLEGRKSYMSSVFGARSHPVLGIRRFHKGVDFAMKPGHAVYASGDAVVEKIKIEMRGYGRQIILDHGFGYKTRYAHLKNIYVAEGMKVRRGEMIATTGNSGISSGPHLHYEVIYKGRNVNPQNYFDRDMSVSQYRDIIANAASRSEKKMPR